MQIHTLKREHKNSKKKRVGRGGKRGKTSGRGTKGQKARSGRKMRPEMRDIIKKIPKLRGYRFQSINEKPTLVHTGTLGACMQAGEKITPLILSDRGIIARRKGKIPAVKILLRGNVGKAVHIEGCAISQSARVQVEKNGGSVVVSA